MPHARAAGVREASGEETAGQVHSVVPRCYGELVALALCVLVGAIGRDRMALKAVADADGAREVEDLAATNLGKHDAEERCADPALSRAASLSPVEDRRHNASSIRVSCSRDAAS